MKLLPGKLYKAQGRWYYTMVTPAPTVGQTHWRLEVGQILMHLGHEEYKNHSELHFLNLDGLRISVVLGPKAIDRITEYDFERIYL